MTCSVDILNELVDLLRFLGPRTCRLANSVAELMRAVATSGLDSDSHIRPIAQTGITIEFDVPAMDLSLDDGCGLRHSVGSKTSIL